MSCFARFQKSCSWPFFFASTMFPCTHYKLTKQLVSEKAHHCKTLGMSLVLLSIGSAVSTVIVGTTTFLGMKYLSDNYDEPPNDVKILACTAITSIGINSLWAVAGAIHGACNNHHHINANETEATYNVETSLSGSTEAEIY